MLPDLWTAPTDAPPTRSLEIATRFPQHPQPKPKIAQTDLYPTEELLILCPPPGVAGFETFLTGRIWTFGDIVAKARDPSWSDRCCSPAMALVIRARGKRPSVADRCRKSDDAVEQGDEGIVEMALPSGAPTMRDRRSLFVVSLVSAVSLQSSGEEGRDGALRWTGLTRAELHAGGDVGFWATAEGVGGGDERER